MGQDSYFPLQGTEWKPPTQVHTEIAPWVQVAAAPPPGPHFSPECGDHLLWREASPVPRSGCPMEGVWGPRPGARCS